ncbi:nitroreductase family protein [Serratia bockelmannii]|uniref:nitroreductase family protein n=1 Tax=Serratia bockelmannii TaxID=2703793 RepID=UPI00313E6B24
MLSIFETIKSRTSANSYDSAGKLSDAEILELIELATQAPSAFNGQNWKFIAVRSEEAKKRLLSAAYGQQKVVDAAVTFIVCGKLDIHQTLAIALKPSLDKNILSEDLYQGWIGAAQRMYQGNIVFQRDEAVRSASLAAMTLMLAAQGKGLVSCPMIGFNPEAVAESFNLEAEDVPVMLITVGYPGAGNWPKKPRKPATEVVSFS